MATKSVLSQSANMQSGSALALGSLMNKSSKKKEGSAPREGSAPPQAASPESPSPESNAKPSKPRPDATKSVLSAATGLKSGSAMALAGALNQQSSKKREGSAERSNDAQSSIAGSAQPPQQTQQKANATKSVLSAASGMQSSSAMALAGAFNQPKRKPATETAAAAPSANGGATSSSAPIEPTSPSEPADPNSPPPWMSAGQPTQAEQQKRAGPAPDPTAPLLHPDDWQQGYMDRQPQAIHVEHDGRTKAGAWGCCTSSAASKADVITKPKNSAVHSRHLLIQPPKPPQSESRANFEKTMLGLSLQCGTCSKEIIQEIIDI